jgi:hypothetical protein
MGLGMRLFTAAFAASILLAAGSARADDDVLPATKPLSQPVATTGVVVAIAGGVATAIGGIGWMIDGIASFGRSPLFCFSLRCPAPTIDNTPRDVLGAMAIAGAGAAVVGFTMYFVGSARVRVSPTVGGAMVEGTF